MHRHDLYISTSAPAPSHLNTLHGFSAHIISSRYKLAALYSAPRIINGAKFLRPFTTSRIFSLASFTMERITSLWTKKSHEGPHSCSHCIKWRLVFSHPRDYQVLYCYRDWKDVLKKARTCQLLAILLEEFKRDERTREKMTDPKADPEEDFFIEGSFRQDVGYAGPSRGHNCYNYWGLALSLKKSWAKTNEKSAVFHLSVHDGKL